MSDGPWTVSTREHRGRQWWVVAAPGRKGRLIGPVGTPRSHSKTNYRERAEEEADRRNAELLREQEGAK